MLYKIINYNNRTYNVTLQEQINEATEMRSLYIKAEKAVLQGQSYNIGGQSLTRANLSEIIKARKEWEAVIQSLTGGRRIMGRIIPMDG